MTHDEIGSDWDYLATSAGHIKTIGNRCYYTAKKQP